MVYELNGTCCYPLQLGGKVRKSIARTRTFGEDTADLGAIQAALATFVGQAAYRLRESNQLTQRIGIFAQTNKHKPGFTGWKNEAYFEIPTADTGRLMHKVMELFDDIYSGSVLYHRAGVYMWDFLPANQVQTDLFGDVKPAEEAKSWARMQALDSVNSRYGRKALRYAAEDLGRAWRPTYRLRSPRYTSRWDELPTVRPL
jgi:DNA polymerase V